jgi:response regulator of citrate/malate metabolism
MKKGLKTLIVEDEPLTRSLLASMLAVHPEVEIIGMAGSVAEARAFLERETPDLLFLDMEIAGTPGLDLLENIPSRVLTVFVSAVADHALQALDFGARGYLLKPVDSARLAIVLGRFGATPPGVPAPRSAGVPPAWVSRSMARSRRLFSLGLCTSVAFLANQDVRI